MNDHKDLPESCQDKPLGVQLGTSQVESAADDAGEGVVVGIDLGTTFSLVATVGEDGEPQCLSGLVPSIVYFPEGEGQDPLVGASARDLAVEAPRRTIFSVKRLMGKGLDEVDSELELVPYSVVDRDQKMVVVRVGDRDYTPQEISALILRQVRELAEKQLGCPVSKAVVTVPAYFDDSQRQATRDAGRIAGLDVLRIVNEPTAAALAYGLHEGRDGVVVVYDLGGGTFDCSILRISGGVFQVLSTNGDTHLGGDDFDQAIMKIVLPEIRSQLGSEPGDDLGLLQAVRLAAIEAKHSLSSAASTEFQVTHGTLDYRREVTRDEFEARVESLVERSLTCCRRALADADLSSDQVDEVVLVGGSTRVPMVRARVKELFSREPHTDLDPDQVVALGAAVQANILAGKTTDYLLLDVTPLSLGIETFGGAVSKIIMRNSTVPARADEEYTTFVEGQVSVDIHILQGEREMAADCRSLGRFKLRGIPPMPAGVPRIEVTFLIDESGILTVSAVEKRSGQSASVEVLPSHGLTEDEVNRMVRASIEFAQDDVQKHRLVSLRNEAETMLRATDGAVDRHRQVLDKTLVESIAKASEELRALVADCDEADRLHRATEALNEATKPLADVVLRVAVTGESS